MPETLTRLPEAITERHYDHKSFELVFSKFCSGYDEKLSELGLKQSTDNESFLGLPPKSTTKQMGSRLYEASKAMGDPPRWDATHSDGVSMQEAILLSARYLAWQATMGSLTQRYIDKINDKIDIEKAYQNHNGRQNLNKLFFEREKAVSILLAQNHAIRDHFDSGLAKRLGSDSPEKIDSVLRRVKSLGEYQREALVHGISLEIATKKFVEKQLKEQNRHDLRVAYGNDNEDAHGGDLVILNGREMLFLDIKSSMPKKFTGGEAATPDDFQRGYKWLEDGPNGERKVVVWAYMDRPVSGNDFKLDDARLAHNLENVVNTAIY